MTSADDRQPGGSEYVERKEVTVHRFPDADASPPRGIGGSGAGSTVSSGRLKAHTEDTLTATEAQALEAIIARPYVEECAQLRVALEAAQREIAKAQDAYERMADDRDGWRRQYAQSRATEAELRAKVERRDAVVTRARDVVLCRDEQPMTEHGCIDELEAWIDALDAAEQPRFIGSQNGEKPILNQSEPMDAAEPSAPPKTAPRVRSANASVSDDRSDLETAEEG